jgi:hypothetical protein
MKSRPYVTRFNSQANGYLGWRLSVTRSGVVFRRYFPDKRFGGAKKSLKAAETTLAELLPILDKISYSNGGLSTNAIIKAEVLLRDAV